MIMLIEAIEETVRNGKQLLIGTDPWNKNLCHASLYNQTGLIRENHIISNDLYTGLMILAVLTLGGSHIFSITKRRRIEAVSSFHKWIVAHEAFFHIIAFDFGFEGIFRKPQACKRIYPNQNNYISIKADSIISLMEKTMLINPIVKPSS